MMRCSGRETNSILSRREAFFYDHARSSLEPPAEPGVFKTIKRKKVISKVEITLGTMEFINTFLVVHSLVLARFLFELKMQELLKTQLTAKHLVMAIDELIPRKPCKQQQVKR